MIERASRLTTFLYEVTRVATPFLLLAGLLWYVFAGATSAWLVIPLTAVVLMLSFVAGWLLLVRAHELQDRVKPQPLDEEHLRKVVAFENNRVQNSLAQVSEIRPGMVPAADPPYRPCGEQISYPATSLPEASCLGSVPYTSLASTSSIGVDGCSSFLTTTAAGTSTSMNF